MSRRPTLFLLLALSACHGSSDTPPPLRITSVGWGRPVDVYGWRTAEGLRAPERVETDVVVGPLAGEPGNDVPGFHRWLPRDPGTLQERLLIDAEIGSRAFAELRDRLGAGLQPLDSAPVARDAALVVTLSADPRLPEEFFFRHGPGGRIEGPANLEAVQLLDASDPGTAPAPLPIRVVVRGRQLVIDPWIPADEADAWGLPVRPGLPTDPSAPDRPNLRLAVAAEGPAAIPGLSADGATGTTASGGRAHVFDLRAARDDEHGTFLRGGHLPERVAPRLLGQIPRLFVAEVDPPRSGRQRVRLFKGDAAHDVDAGDVLRPRTRDGIPLGVTEVLTDPEDDRGRPGVAFVDVVVTALPGLEELDTRGDPGRPADPSALGDWLATHAADASLIVRYDGASAEHSADDLRWFVRFVPEPPPRPATASSPGGPDRDLSPFVECIAQFDEPLAVASVRPHDTFLIALRDVLDTDALVEDLVTARGIDPSTVPIAKLTTPFLCASRLSDLRGDATTFRLTPVLGLYLDERMRREDGPRAFEDQRYRYFALLQAGPDGVRDRAGNALELDGAADHVAVPFALDLRRDSQGPQEPDNLVAYAVRRFDDADEDERPSPLRDDEVARFGQQIGADALPVPDWFGAHTVAGGRLHARPTARVMRFVDDRNVPQVPPPGSTLPHCPPSFDGAGTFTRRVSELRFGQAVLDPLNPRGARLQTVFREIDLGLSQLDPQDMDLEVESMGWAPWGDEPTTTTVFAGASVLLGHSEWRPEPCLSSFSTLPVLPDSGLHVDFAENVAHDIDPTRGAPVLTAPHVAFADREWRMDPADAFRDPSGTHRYLPLPEFEEPYFVWRDQTLPVQGGDAGAGSDVQNTANVFDPYIASPFLMGRGRGTTGVVGALESENPAWINARNFSLESPTRIDTLTGGLLGALALPLLVDVRIDGYQNGSPGGFGVPVGGGPGLDMLCGQYRGPGDVTLSGLGWTVSLAHGCSPLPAFRAYSGGFIDQTGVRSDVQIGTGDPEWSRALGGYTPTGQRTPPLDNSVYWSAVGFLKRRTVSTAGFVDLLDPHRVDPAVLDDPRLLQLPAMPVGSGANVMVFVDAPPLGPGASIDVEVRAAGGVDPEPWIWRQQGWREELRPTSGNFPLDPRKAGDAGIRKWDDRETGGVPRDAWVFPYNRVVTGYTDDPALLRDPEWLRGHAGPQGELEPHDVRYVNCRVVLRNGVASGRAVESSVDTLALAWRIEPLR